MKNLLETVIYDYKIHNSIELRNWQLQAMKNLERLISNRPISVLVDATCGSGKSTVQHMAIDYVARLKEAE